MGKVLTGLVVLVGIISSLAFAAEGGGTGKGDSDHLAMHLHHMHTLMDHTLIMALDGSNLLMLSRMRGAEELAQLAGRHGKEMLAEGKKSLKEVLSGPEMKAAHERGRWDDPLMGYTHELGAELLAVMADLEKIDVRGATAAQRQMMLNHALEMAAEGSNLVMLGKMGMGGAFDQRTVEHGHKMLSDARKLWDQVVKAEKTKAPQEGARSSASPVADEAFVRHGGKVLALLEKMRALP